MSTSDHINEREIRIPAQLVDGSLFQEFVVDREEIERMVRRTELMSNSRITLSRFQKLISTVCTCSEHKGMTVQETASLLFEKCQTDDHFGQTIMLKAWNMIAEIILKCGALPSGREFVIYKAFVDIAERTYGWKELITEEGKEDSTGPTLCFETKSPNHALDEFKNMVTRSCTLLLQSRARGYERPRCKTDACSVLTPAQRTDPICVNRFMDYHAWCIDSENNILDYPIEDIESEHWTRDVVYRPFDAEHVSLIYEDLIFFAKQTETYIDTISLMSEKEKVEAIENNSFPKRNCLWRAMALKNKDPERYAVVIGSLGFKQADGSIFWEYG